MHATQPVPMRTYDAPKLGFAAILALTAAIAATLLAGQLGWSPIGRADAPAAGAALLDQRHGEQGLGSVGQDAGFVQQRIGERTLPGRAPAADVVRHDGFSGSR